jgi:acyl-CoA synthetase (AMP-forming)/AMP-acid ligase II
MGFLVTLAVPLCAGATVVTVPRFDPGRFLELLERHRVTVLVGAPPMLRVLAGHPLAAGADLGSLELVVCGGAPLTADAQRALSARLPGATVGQAWGLTETTVGLSMPDRDAGSVPGTVGRVMPNTELRVVDPGTGRDLAAGQPGELLARGPQVMAGYLHRPEATAAMVDPDGWLRTGDLGLVDGEGNVVIVDRLKELIKVSGYQVAPAELEALLATHPAVADAAVLRRPDPASGEVPVAVVVPRPGAGPTPTSCSPGWPSGWSRTSGSAPSASPTPSPGRRRASCCAGPWPTRTPTLRHRGRASGPARRSARCRPGWPRWRSRSTGRSRPPPRRPGR